MWRRIVVVCVVPLALVGCGGDPVPEQRRTQATATTTTTAASSAPDSPADDADLMRMLLGGTSPRCPTGTPMNNTTCGELMASAKKLVDLVDVALDGMPANGPYVAVNEAVTSFNDAYSTLESTGCYTAAPVGGVDESFCQTLADLVALSWLNLQSTIDQLR
ncbi:hypothetical protein [Actinophytocola glycyrrhizae]|uniref:Lipoprotein n=1 Tax=Actinophytocola glycyrrhizae TaxID=2044873 RepID=A0ABV9S5F7_9PSEU